MIMRTMHEGCTVADLRLIMHALFPEVDDRADPENAEHPMTAVGLVLLSAAVIDTTEATKLALFTGYRHRFISAITFNMQNNRLWVDGQYDATEWLRSDGTIDADTLWDHVEFACGDLWMPSAHSDIAADPCPCTIYWDEGDGLRQLGRCSTQVN